MKRFGKKLIIKNDKERSFNMKHGYNEFYIDIVFVYQIALPYIY